MKIEELKKEIKKEQQKNSEFLVEFKMFKEIINEKYYKFMHLSHEEKLNAKVIKKNIDK